MDNYQLENILQRYPVTVCAADQIRKQSGRFVISNTDTSNGPGKHWVAFYFPRHGPYEFFDSLGNMPSDYNVGFETVLTNKYWMICDPIQDSKSDNCGIYCAYYVIKRYQGKTLKGIVKEFNPYQKKLNDRSVVSKMKKLIRKKDVT